MTGPLSLTLKVACEIYHRKRCYKRDLNRFFKIDTREVIEELFDWQIITAEYCSETQSRILLISHDATPTISNLHDAHWVYERIGYISPV